MPHDPAARSLDGIRVIDLSRVIAGPWCGALLADMGADVIKVEGVSDADESHTWPPHKDGESAAYLLFNRNKRGMTLDLKSPEGVEIVKKLVAGADVVIENFRTGTMESFGLGYDVLAAINPRLIYCFDLRVRTHGAAQGQRRVRSAHAGLQRDHVDHRRAGRTTRARGRLVPRPLHRHAHRVRCRERDPAS